MRPEEHQLLLEKIVSSLDRIERLLAPNSGAITQNNSFEEINIPDGVLDTIESPVSECDLVENFLASKNIQIKVKKPEDPADSIIDSLSVFLGDRYSALKGILMKIKRSMQNGAMISENISKLTQYDIASVCQFCTRLHAIAFLEQYKYYRSPQYLIHAKTTTLPKAQMFFGGQWLERFTLYKLKQAHLIAQTEADKLIKFQYLINPQVILPNGDDFELDIIAIIGDSPLWIEAKSGDYQQHVQKYSRLARQLNLDYSHSMMVLTDAIDNQCEALSSLFSMTVVNLNTIYDKILDLLRADQQKITKVDMP